MRKGQAAMEFLMSYGWVLIVVLVAIAALAYFGVLDPGQSLPETCIFFPGISCDDFRVNTEGVSFKIINGGGSNLVNISFTILGEGPCAGDSSNVRNIKNGESGIFVINCSVSPSSGTAFRREVQMDYSEEEGLSHKKTGQLQTKVE